MKIFNRKINSSDFLQKITDFNTLLFNAVKQFDSPYQLIKAYLLLSKPPENNFRLKNGELLCLSSNPNDSVTVMVIFCRKEYGKIPSNGIILDIGANIGMFSMYAAINGAKKVFAFEPNHEAFNVLCQNIKTNGLENVIHPFNLGVSERDGKKIYLPSNSSPYNKSTTSTTANDSLQPVDTISLTTIIKDIVCEQVNLCKIDCEGAEYEILYNTPLDVFEEIDTIKMEHHRSSEKKNLIEYLSKLNNYHLVHEQNMILWFEKENKLGV